MKSIEQAQLVSQNKSNGTLQSHTSVVEMCDPWVNAAVTHPVFGEEVGRKGPRRVTHHLVHVAAVRDGVVALLFVHHCEALEFVCEVVAAHCIHR